MADMLTPPARVGFIGLGNMGNPMAHLLAGAGYDMLVHDANPGAVQHFIEANKAAAADSLQHLGNDCQAVITMLPNGAIVREVLTGAAGVLDGTRNRPVIIDMSSSSPLGTRELAGELEQRGITLIDAPVSGGVKKARDGTLAIMAGGDSAVITSVQPLLDTMGQVFHVGGPGAGHAMKALNNYLSAGTLAMTSEAILAGQQFGLEPGRMIEILNASTGRSTASEHKFPTFILPRKFDSGFALGLMAKDLRLALEISRSTGAPCGLLEVLSDIYNRAEKDLGQGADNTDVYRYLEETIEDSENE